jgi:hypothetical protein
MKEKEIDPRLIKKLKTIESVPERNPQAAENGRARFQLEVDKTFVRSLKTVSERNDRRPNGWIQKEKKNLIHRKGLTKMAKVILSIFLAVTAMFTATSVTLVAAQSSQPDEVLYPVKTWTEDVRMNMASNDPKTMLDLALEFANRRISEITGMAAEGKEVSDSVLDRWQLDITFAYQAIIQMQGEDFGPALARVEATLRTQQETMNQVNSNAGTEALLTRSRTMIEEHLRLMTGSGEGEAQVQTQLQQQVQQQLQTSQPEDAGNPEEGALNGQGPNTEMDAEYGKPEDWTQGPQENEDHVQWCYTFMSQMGYDVGSGTASGGANMGQGMGTGTGSDTDSGLGAEYWLMYCQTLLTPQPASTPGAGPGNGNGSGGRP